MKRAVPILLVMVVCLLGVSPAALAAADANSNVSQSYSSSTLLQTGSIVSLTATKTTSVEAANLDNASRVLGVVVTGNNTLVAVNPDPTKAQVASSGSALTLVSTLGGDIKSGDPVAVSAFNGIGTKGGEGNYIVGHAQGDFNSKSEGASERQVTDSKTGAKKTISVGYVSVAVAPSYIPPDQGAAKLTGLQKFVHSLTGHTVSTPRIVVSLVITVLTVVTISVLTYAAIYGSIISIGRNPLAREAVIRALVFVLILASLATVAAFILVYFLLR